MSHRVAVCVAGVVRYLSDFVGETLIPYLSTQTVNTKLRKILEDKDALSPIATDRKAASKLPNKGTWPTISSKLFAWLKLRWWPCLMCGCAALCCVVAHHIDMH